MTYDPYHSIPAKFMIPYRKFIYGLTAEEIEVLRTKSDNKKLVKLIHGSLLYHAKNKENLIKKQEEKKEDKQEKLIIHPPPSCTVYTGKEHREHIRKLKEEFQQRMNKHTPPKIARYPKYTPEEFQKAMEKKQEQHIRYLEKQQQKLLSVHPLMKKSIDEEYKKLEEERKKRIAEINKE